jgi:hypothetical protein
MASVARVRNAELYREFRAWNPHTVIAPRIYDHVGSGRHMTFHALRAWSPDVVEMMPHGIVLLCRVALKTDAAALRAKLQAMRFVTITAGHSGMEHPALNE